LTAGHLGHAELHPHRVHLDDACNPGTGRDIFSYRHEAFDDQPGKGGANRGVSTCLEARKARARVASTLVLALSQPALGLFVGGGADHGAGEKLLGAFALEPRLAILVRALSALA